MFDLLHIRRAQQSDATQLAAIGYAAWEKGILPLLQDAPAVREKERRRLAGYTHECFGRIVVAEYDGEIAGWCSRARARAYIPFLFVAPHIQGRGIGTALLQRVESLLELEGHDHVVLETPADHVRAVRFYEQQGYFILAMKADGRSHHEPLMSVRLEKRLNPFRGAIDDIE